MTLSLLLAGVLAQAPLPPGAQELPPNHPPLTGTPAAPPLPPGAQLPPNHPGAGSGQAPNLSELLKKLDAMPDVMGKEKSFELAASIGRLYFSQGRYQEAGSYFQQALQKAEPLRAFYLAQKKAVGAAKLPDAASVGCAATVDSQVEALLARAQEKQRAKELPAAVACAEAAMRPVMETENLVGHAKFLQRDSAGALAAYEKAMELDANPEARYSHGALLLDARGDDPKSLKAAQADFEKFLNDAPSSPRAGQARRLLERAKEAIALGGVSKVPVKVAAAPPPPEPASPPLANAPFANGAAEQGGTPPALTPEMIQAFQSQANTPETKARVAKALDDAENFLSQSRFQEALDSYKQVMPFQPENPRVRAGMAWTLVKLNKQPMAERVWGIAVQTPEAVSSLGDTLQSKGDATGAKELWKKLAESAPDYAPKLQGKL